MILQVFTQLSSKLLRVKQVLYSQGTARYFIFIRWTDATTCCANLSLTTLLLTRMIDCNVTQIYGRSTEPMRGGLSFLGKPFTEEERAKAVDDLSAQVKASFEAGAAGAAGKGMIAPQGLASLGDLDIKGMPPVGSSVADYEAQADAISRRYVLKKTEIEEMLRHELGRVLGPATDTGRYTFKDLEVTVERFDAASGTASLDLRGVVVKS